MRNILDACLDLFFPKVCAHCGDAFREGLSNVLCRACFDSVVPYRAPLCVHCGMGLLEGAFGGAEEPRCRDCREGEWVLDRAWTFGAYEGALRIAHHAFKFEGMAGLATALAERMGRALPVDHGEGDWSLVPVPLSPERERERGYHPTRRLAELLSSSLGIPVRELLRKIRSTPSQMSLPREKRIGNPKGAFALRDAREVPPWILLVDDVYTTGSTLEECAKVLKKAGAGRVEALVLARTEHH